ncbi:FMN-binding protein [Pilimelia columellifera]|uniref:FMN-binding protein n=1 Tax=Pilimelia columellifera subsp. columellifera TaxID=706583 RepID=A0ABP6AD58_9ACTN
MRRSTAAVVGTLAGAAMLLGVRLSATPVAVAATGSQATEPVDSDQVDRPAKPGRKPSGGASAADSGGDSSSGRSGRFRGDTVTNPYGSVRVTITVADGEITRASAAYPNEGQSAAINGPAVPQLNESAVKAQDADIDSVSGATYTSDSYRKSLQAAIDRAGL